jgi:DNA-directed RNA polymerase subunit RPC12/RpoP
LRVPPSGLGHNSFEEVACICPQVFDMTVKCEDCGFVDDSIGIDAGIFISRDGRITCRRCGSRKIVALKPKSD